MVVVPIPVPIGAKRIAIVEGVAWKFVVCERCEEHYVYRLKLEARGVDHAPLFLDGDDSWKRAAIDAEKNLKLKSQNMVAPIPCPTCGLYQEEMVQRMKEDAASNGLMIAGLAIGGLSLVPLLFSVPYIWIVTVVGVIAGIAIIAYGDIAARKFDPNAGDPEPRKKIGQRKSLRGEQYQKLLTLIENAQQAESSPPPKN